MQLLHRIERANALEPSGEIQCAAGEDLYLLIDGGAEIYREYGFVEAVFQSYEAEEGAPINLEIFRMTDPGAAYGMYTSKTGLGGSPVTAGSEGWFESYYLNFWKGSFVVTITALDADSGAVRILMDVARAVDEGLQEASERPLLASLLPRDKLRANGITYLRGPVALNNVYPFDTEDIFKLKEAVSGEYAGYTLFIVRYGNEDEAHARFESAGTRLRGSGRFVDFIDRDASFECKDAAGRRIAVKRHARHLVIVVAAPDISEEFVAPALEMRLPR